MGVVVFDAMRQGKTRPSAAILLMSLAEWSSAKSHTDLPPGRPLYGPAPNPYIYGQD